MKREDFDNLFQNEFIEPLSEDGFKTSGKSIYRNQGVGIIALMRLGGRFSTPSSVSHVLCFRHVFLRDMKEQIQIGYVKEAFSYPYKFSLDEIQNKSLSEWRYEPHNLRLPFDKFDYERLDERQVKDWLQKLLLFLKDMFVLWCNSLTAEKALKEIQTYGESAWCEKMWIEDYKQYLN